MRRNYINACRFPGAILQQAAGSLGWNWLESLPFPLDIQQRQGDPWFGLDLSSTRILHLHRDRVGGKGWGGEVKIVSFVGSKKSD